VRNPKPPSGLEEESRSGITTRASRLSSWRSHRHDQVLGVEAKEVGYVIQPELIPSSVFCGQRRRGMASFAVAPLGERVRSSETRGIGTTLEPSRFWRARTIDEDTSSGFHDIF